MKNWEKKEKNDAKLFGGKRIKASGSLWYAPGDVKTDRFLIDSKDTSKDSFSLNKQKLQKLYDEGLFSYKIPMMSINISGMEVCVFFKDDVTSLLKILEDIP